MKIEAGKTYRTRSGGKVAVVAVDNPFGMKTNYPVIGYIDGYQTPKLWMQDGSFADVGNDHRNDLVAEWQEPVTFERWIYFLRYSDGRVSAIVDEEEPSQRYFSGKVIARRQITITEGEGLAN